MREPVPVIAALEYASSRQTRRGRDVVFFAPSRRSMVVVLLAVGVAFWVARRHVAWREVAGGGGGAFDPLATSISFTPEGRLLLCGVGAGGRGGGIANVYDAENGRLLYRLGRARSSNGAGGFTFPLKRGPGSRAN